MGGGGESVCMWRMCACGEGGGRGMWGLIDDLGYDLHVHAHHQPKMLVLDDFYLMKKSIILGDLVSLSNISLLKQYRLVVSLCTSSLLAVSSS